MRKIIVSENVTLDGFFSGPKGKIDFFVRDKEIIRHIRYGTNLIDTILFGRTTYELMVSYWPTPAAAGEEPVITNFMNNTPKIVFSKTLEKAVWNNTGVIKEIKKEEILKMKQQPGKDIIIFGSGSIVSTLTKLGLIDDYLIFVNPVILGSGKPLFKDINDRINLKLLSTKKFNNGVVLLQYQRRVLL